MSVLPLARLALLAVLLLPCAALAVDDMGDDAVSKTDANAAKADADTVEYEIIYKDSEFKPFELVVAGDKKLKIIVKNDGLTPIEFESKQLNREKIIQPNREVVINLPPLKVGTYKYFNEFNAGQKGFITVK